MTDQFNRLAALKLDDSVRASLLMEGFNAFVQVGDKKRAKKILDAMTSGLVPDGRKELAAAGSSPSRQPNRRESRFFELAVCDDCSEGFSVYPFRQ